MSRPKKERIRWLDIAAHLNAEVAHRASALARRAGTGSPEQGATLALKLDRAAELRAVGSPNHRLGALAILEACGVRHPAKVLDRIIGRLAIGDPPYLETGPIDRDAVREAYRQWNRAAHPGRPPGSAAGGRREE